MQQQIIDNITIFSNIDTINISTIHRTLQRNNILMKNLDMIPVGCNTPSKIEQHLEYVRQSIMASSEPVIFLDEAGFNLRWHRGRNVIGKTAAISLQTHVVETSL